MENIIIKEYRDDSLEDYEYIIHISDIHIRLKSREEEYKSVFENLYKKLRKINSKKGLIVITGDIFHDKLSLTPEAIILCTELFINLSSILKTIVIPGNHDGLLNSNEKVDVISGVLYGKDIRDLIYLKESGIYKFNNLIFGCSSVFENIFVDINILNAVVKKKKWTTAVKIGLYHGMVGDLLMEGLCVAKGEKSIDDFKGYDYVLLGDIHIFKYLNEKKNIAYASSLISQNFSETDPYHGYIYWDIKNGTSKYEIVENIYHHKICKVKGKEFRMDNIVYDLSDPNHILNLESVIPKKGQIKVFIESNEEIEYYKQIKQNYKEVSWTEVVNTLINKGMMDKEKMGKVEIEIKDVMKEILKREDYELSDLEYISKDLEDRKNSRDKKGNNWEMLNIEISNLFLYGTYNKIDLDSMDKNQVILIHGQNNIGKSSIIDIISIILYNKMGRKMNTGNKKLNEILNINKREGYGRLLFKVENRLFLIERIYKRKRNKEIKVDIFLYKLLEYDESKNEEKYVYKGVNYNKVLKTKGNSVNEDIDDLLGSNDDFIFMNIMLQFDNISFRNMKQSSRKELLSRLLELDVYDELREQIAPIYEEKTDVYKSLKKRLDEVDILTLDSNQTKKKKILKENRKILLEKQSKIDYVRNKIIELNRNYVIINSIDIDNLEKYEEEIIRNKDLINGIQTEKYKYEKEIYIFLENENEILKTKIENDKLIKGLTDDLYKRMSCKRSLYEVHETKEMIEINIESIKKEIIMIEEYKEEYKNYILEYNEILNSYNLKFEEMKSVINEIDYEIKNLNILKINEKIDLVKIKKELESLEEELEGKNELIVNLNKYIEEEEKSNILELNDKNKTNKDKLQKVNNEIESKKRIIEDLEIYEYNPKCKQCMKNPKVVELLRLKNELDKLYEEKEKINKELDNNIEERVITYESKKSELNIYYKELNIKDKNRNELKIKIENQNRIERKLFLEENKIKINKEWDTNEIIKEREMKENKKKELENKIERINKLENDKMKLDSIMELINKNEIMKEENEKIENELKEMKDNIEILENNEVYNKYIVEKRKKDENDKIIKRLEIEENDINNILNELIIQVKNIKKDLENIQNNKIIEEESKLLKIEAEKLNEEIKYLELNNYKDEQEIINNDKIIETYHENKLKFKDVYDNYRIYKNYMELLHKNGLALHILKRYLGLIANGINVVIEQFLNKKIDLFVEKDDIVLNINVLSKEDNHKYNILMLGGREAFMLDIAFKLIMSNIATLPKSNFLFIDEGISVLDKENLSNIKDLFSYLTDNYDYVFLISHIEGIKDYVSKTINIKKIDGYSKIVMD